VEFELREAKFDFDLGATHIPEQIQGSTLQLLFRSNLQAVVFWKHYDNYLGGQYLCISIDTGCSMVRGPILVEAAEFCADGAIVTQSPHCQQTIPTWQRQKDQTVMTAAGIGVHSDRPNQKQSDAATFTLANSGCHFNQPMLHLPPCNRRVVYVYILPSRPFTIKLMTSNPPLQAKARHPGKDNPASRLQAAVTQSPSELRPAVGIGYADAAPRNLWLK